MNFRTGDCTFSDRCNAMHDGKAVGKQSKKASMTIAVKIEQETANEAKSKNLKDDECYICAGGRTFRKTAGTGDTKGCKGKGKQKGNGKGKKSKDKNNPVTELLQDDSQSSSSSQMIANFTSEWIFAVK